MVEQCVKLRSERSTERVKVRFRNQTERTVEIIWIDFDGIHVTYELLEKRGNFVDIHTFTKHPWIAVDYLTGDRLLIEKEYIFFPQIVEEPQQNQNPDTEMNIRALITLPLYSLKYISLLTVWKSLKNSEDADRLELPKDLIRDLKRIATKNNDRPEARLSLREYLFQFNAWR